MRTMTVIGAAAVAAFVTMAEARAESPYDLEGARANARAGGPISEYDAFLLERWGMSSGGPPVDRALRRISEQKRHDAARWRSRR